MVVYTRKPPVAKLTAFMRRTNPIIGQTLDSKVMATAYDHSCPKYELLKVTRIAAVPFETKDGDSAFMSLRKMGIELYLKFRLRHQQLKSNSALAFYILHGKPKYRLTTSHGVKVDLTATECEKRLGAETFAIVQHEIAQRINLTK